MDVLLLTRGRRGPNRGCIRGAMRLPALHVLFGIASLRRNGQATSYTTWERAVMALTSAESRVVKRQDDGRKSREQVRLRSSVSFSSWRLFVGHQRPIRGYCLTEMAAIETATILLVVV